MPFRERIKKTFRRTSSSASASKEYDPSDRSSPLYYQPGEKIPYKYRRPVEPEHKARLDGFSFGSAWRRVSSQSQYSPHGSRMPSRNNSEAAPGVKHLEGVRLSMGSLDDGASNASRNGSIASAASREKKLAAHAVHHHDFDPNKLETIMSVQTGSREESPPNGKEVEAAREKRRRSDDDAGAFSVDELDRALELVEKRLEPTPKS